MRRTVGEEFARDGSLSHCNVQAGEWGMRHDGQGIVT